MINRIIKIAAAVIIIPALFLVSCSTVQNKDMKTERSGRADPMYYGYGSGATSIEALELAKKDAAKSAAVDLLGRAAAEGQKGELDAFFDSVSDIQPYIIPGSQETVESSNTEGFYYHLGIRVNLAALASKLKSENILGGQVDGRTGNEYRLKDQKHPSVSTAEPENKPPAPEAVRESSAGKTTSAEDMPETTAEEIAVIRDYLDSLTYMVYFDEDSDVDRQQIKTAIASANRYLEQQGYEYIDLSQIERIKEDQRIVYEEETGEAVSIIQWIAHKLNADIYIEISLGTNSRAENGNYYGSANVTLNCFNASTAEGRGSAVYQTIPPAFSRISEEDAVMNAVSSAVFNGMQSAVTEAENQTARAAAKGFKYSLNLLNTADSKVIRDFEKKIERRVKSIKRVSYSPEESMFEVYFIGDIFKLEDLVYDTAETIPGLEGILLVMQRGNSITFDTGL